MDVTQMGVLVHQMAAATLHYMAAAAQEAHDAAFKAAAEASAAATQVSIEILPLCFRRNPKRN
jgi:hypothetical protein